MIYRRLGSTGLKTSVLALGTGGLHNIAPGDAQAIFRRAYDAGINHFDTAESYGGGQAEVMLGEILRGLNVGREKFILATKAFSYGWSVPAPAPHEMRTLNRKYLLQAIDGSLKRLGVDFVDIYYCHQEDLQTPVEETVNAMNDIVQSGRARYWAVSNWKDKSLGKACNDADRYGRHRPIINQIEYNALHRAAANATIDAATRHGLGLAVWGPLAGGLLSGKYIGGVPQNSRATDAAMAGSGIKERLIDGQRNAIVAQLATIAGDLDCSVGQLAIAWTLAQPLVCTTLTFASNLGQLEQNLGAVGVVEKLTAEMLARIADIVGDYDQSNIPESLSNG